MRQSVMGQTVSTGSSGVGFALRTVVINEVDPVRNICRASDIQTNEAFPLGLTKRGDSTVWPMVGDAWLIDRSMGHWALKCRITPTSPPVFTSTLPSRTPDMAALLKILSNAGLIVDHSPAPAMPTISGSRNDIGSATGALIDALTQQGIVSDLTTAATVPIGVWQTPALTSPWINWPDANYQTARYRRLPYGEVVVEGLAGTGSTPVSPPATVFTLPVGFRPLKTLAWSTVAGGSSAPSLQLEVNASGAVLLRPGSAVAINFVSLNCRFSVS